MQKTREEVHEIFERFLTAVDDAKAHPGNAKKNDNAVAHWYDMLAATGTFDVDEEFTERIIEMELSLLDEKGLPSELREKARQSIKRDITAARERAAKQ